ncbi:LEA type 2 family protein [Flavobacteriaceae bacterium M23B6Z8]
MKKILGLMIITMIMISCQKKKPEFLGIDRVSINGLKEEKLLIDIDYSIYNPNNVSTELRQSSMAVFYKDTLVGNGYLYKEIKLPASDTITLPVRCEIELKTLSKYYPELIMQDTSVFSLKGDSKVDFFMSSFNIAIEDQIAINTKEIIHNEITKRLSGGKNFKLKEISFEKLPSFNETEIQLTIGVINSLPFDYELRSMHLTFYDDRMRSKLGSWSLSSPIEQPAETQTEIPVAAKVRNLNMLKQGVFAVLSSKKRKVNIVGTAEILIKGHSFRIPVEESMPINLSLLSGF